MSNNHFSFGMSDAPKDFGSPPNLDPSEVYQYYPDTCAIRSQELILKDFGINISQEELIQEAIYHGWYTPGQGTSPEDVGKLLELNGVPVRQYENGNIFSLVNELAQGHKVIVGVDANELWSNGPDWLDIFGINTPNHALLVSNIDTTDPNNITVTLTDPGTGDVAKVYSFAQFEDAWRDSNCFVVATQEPSPPTLDYMCNFDYETGYLDTVFNGLPFEDFQTNFGSLFDLNISSQAFQTTLHDTIVNSLNNPFLKDWASAWVGHVAEMYVPGSGIPTKILVQNAIDNVLDFTGLSDRQSAPSLGALSSDQAGSDLLDLNSQSGHDDLIHSGGNYPDGNQSFNDDFASEDPSLDDSLNPPMDDVGDFWG